MKKKIINKQISKRNRGNLLGGVLVGAVVGATAGLLLAPESGKKMRNEIKKISGDFYHQIAPPDKNLKRASEMQYSTFTGNNQNNFIKKMLY